MFPVVPNKVTFANNGTFYDRLDVEGHVCASELSELSYKLPEGNMGQCHIS